MKKKLLATLVAGVVLSLGLIGLTACGGGGGGNGVLSINKGEEVNEDDWKAAITATQAAENYTIDSYDETETKTTGTMNEIPNINCTVVYKTETKMYYYYDNATYSYSTLKLEVSNVPAALKDVDGYKALSYVEEAYSVKEGDKYYSGNYDNYYMGEWMMYSVTSVSDSPIDSMINQYFSITQQGLKRKVNELYDEFTYSEGVYTATLWNNFGNEVKISVSIKDGYVVGIASEYGYEAGGDGYSQVSKVKIIYNISDYGSTTVNPSAAAKQAVEDFKASQN